jgi:hypothetical protein
METEQTTPETEFIPCGQKITELGTVFFAIANYPKSDEWYYGALLDRRDYAACTRGDVQLSGRTEHPAPRRFHIPENDKHFSPFEDVFPEFVLVASGIIKSWDGRDLHLMDGLTFRSKKTSPAV